MRNDEYNDISVFIFGANGRQALPVCRGFYELGCNVISYCSSKLDTGYLTKYATKRIVNKNTDTFFSEGVKLIKENKYSLVVPLGDKTAKFLSDNKDELEKHTSIAINKPDIYCFANDKAKTMQVCMENGIPAPFTIYGNDIFDERKIDKLKFPVVVKPRTGIGSIGFNIINDKAKIKEYINNYNNENGELLIQEYIEQGNHPQLRVDLFRDREGNYKTAILGKVTRWYPLDGGSGIYCETIHNEEVVSNCKRLLNAINWNGYANIDLVWDEKESQAKIVEINGRTGASIMLDYISGINISRQILENELGFEVTEYSEYQDGKSISCFMPDFLWLLKSPNRFDTNPSWFKRGGTKDVIFSLNDIKPSIGFFLQSVSGYKESMKLRKRG